VKEKLCVYCFSSLNLFRHHFCLIYIEDFEDYVLNQIIHKEHQVMKHYTRIFAAVLTIGLSHAGAVSAAIQYDQDVTSNLINGSGNLNGNFAVNQNNGIEVGLRGKLRFNASGSPENTFNSNGDGTYSFDAGVAPTKSSPVAVWSFEWSINSDFDGSGGHLDGFSYLLGYDNDASLGTNFTSFDPINLPYADHAIGDNSTANGDGAVAATDAGYASLIAGNSLAQNSWQPHWFLSPFDPTVDGTYDFFLAAYDETGIDEIARTEMQIIVGAGGSVVPEPSTVFLFGLGLLGFGYLKNKRST
jgi:hypothetical protein